eukprot:8624036-Alexandrium_andersonii.AAC.2
MPQQDLLDITPASWHTRTEHADSASSTYARRHRLMAYSACARWKLRALQPQHHHAGLARCMLHAGQHRAGNKHTRPAPSASLWPLRRP